MLSRESCHSTTYRWVTAILLSRLMQIFPWPCPCSSSRLMSRYSSTLCFNCSRRGDVKLHLLGVRSRRDGWLYGCTFWSQVTSSGRTSGSSRICLKGIYECSREASGATEILGDRGGRDFHQRHPKQWWWVTVFKQDLKRRKPSWKRSFLEHVA